MMLRLQFKRVYWLSTHLTHMLTLQMIASVGFRTYR